MKTITESTSEIYFKDILSLDFSMLKRKLQDKEEGENWTIDQCEETEIEYKRFLALKRKYPEKDIVPGRFQT